MMFKPRVGLLGSAMMCFGAKHPAPSIAGARGSVLSRNGGRDLLFTKKDERKKKKEKRRKSCRVGSTVGKNVVDQAQRNSNRTESRESTNEKAMVSGETNVKEEIGESARQFAELSEEVSLHAREERLRKK